MSDDTNTGTEYLAKSFARLLGVLREKNVLTEEEMAYIRDEE